MENVNGVNISESAALVNRLAQQIDSGAGVTRRQQRQMKRDEARRLREQAFIAHQPVTRAEIQQLMNGFVRLAKEVSDYKGFVSNIFFVLDHKGVISLKEMDEIAKLKNRELKEFGEIAGNKDIPLPEKIELAKQKGLSQVFIDMLAAPEQAHHPQVQPVGT